MVRSLSNFVYTESSGSDYPSPSKGKGKASKLPKGSQETISWDVLSNQAKYCNKCNQTFTSSSELREHIKLGIHKDEKGWYTCPMCNLQFEFLRTLQVHEEVQHKGEKPAAEPENDSSSDEGSFKGRHIWGDHSVSYEGCLEQLLPVGESVQFVCTKQLRPGLTQDPV